MADIRVISTNTIQAPPQSHGNGDSTQKIDLTPWDLQFLPVEFTQRGLLFRKPKPIDTSTQIQHLKDSLSSTLAFFPPLAGRLVIVEHEDNTASSFIVCNNAGAMFVHAVAENTTVADILEPNYVPSIVYSLFSLNGVINYECTSKPFLAVQVTELVDGIFIGCAMNHVVADGQSFWHLVNSWAEISRGYDRVSKLPALERWFLEGIDRPIRFPFAKEKQNSENFNRHPLPERIFHFTKEKIAQLKWKANAEVSTDKISSLQAVLTHLWRSVIRSKRLEPQEDAIYIVVVGARPRMRPPLPENYFGNAMMGGAVTMKAGELLLEGGLGKGAWEMNKMISLHSEEKIKSHYESWVKNPALVTGREIPNAVMARSSPRFDFYGNDFGWGKPIAVRSGAANEGFGKVTLFAGADEGSIDIEVCLPHEILEAMGKDPEFMDAISI